VVEFVGHLQTLAGLADTICVTYSCQLLLVDLAGHLASVRLRYGLGRESTVWLVLKALSVGLAMKVLWLGLGSTVCLA
jgi:hypothetical protein